MRHAVLAAMALAAWCAGFAQGQSAKVRPAVGNRDQLGMTCAQILALSSADWVVQFNQKASDTAGAGEPSQENTLRAIGAYAKCYDARTDRLAGAAARKGTAPPMAARANFRDFAEALENFTVKGLAANDPPADAVKTAYARLYQKQFRYEFYQGAESRVPQGAEAKRAAAPPAKSAKAAASSSKDGAGVPQAQGGSKSASPRNVAGTAADDADPMTLAKNQFGQLLDALPEDKMHDLHSAFGDIVSREEMTEAARLAVYRYAIFVLQPVTAQPFWPPPF